MANKYLKQSAGTLTEQEALVTSAGAGDAGKIPALDGTGRFDTSLMPVGVAADTASVAASENLAAGDLVNIHDSGGAKVRKADASSAGKEAVGFVLAAVVAPANALVYFEGTDTQVSGLTPGGPQFLSATTPGLATNVAPSASGQVVQRVGFATAATSLNFEPQQPIVLA